MPEEKAAVYQTRLEAGEFLVMAEVPEGKGGEIQLLLESAGGQEIAINSMTLPRPCAGTCNSPEDLSPEVRTHLSPDAQITFIQRYNAVLAETADAMKAEQAAWETIHQEYEEDENGVWSKSKVTV
jgi:cation transport regulator ChaB